MKVFVPRRSQQKNEGNPPEPSVKSAKSLPTPPFGTFDQPELAQSQKKNMLEPRRDPTPAALGVLTKLNIQTAPDQPRPVPTPTKAVQLEPLTVWAAIHTAIPECITIMRENKYPIAWLEYRSPSRGWVSTDPVSATRDALEQLVRALAQLEPDALCVAIRGAVSLHRDVNPAWQGARQGVSQLARFSRKEVNA